MLKVEEKLSKGWGVENAYHVSGYRDLLVDGGRNVSRASPPGSSIRKISFFHLFFGSRMVEGQISQCNGMFVDMDCLSTCLIVGLPCRLPMGHFSIYMKIRI
jgi:hypothetical protein